MILLFLSSCTHCNHFRGLPYRRSSLIGGELKDTSTDGETEPTLLRRIERKNKTPCLRQKVENLLRDRRSRHPRGRPTLRRFVVLPGVSGEERDCREYKSPNDQSGVLRYTLIFSRKTRGQKKYGIVS